MDDYTVGSLADLITGSNTPNKPKVTQKAFKKKTNDSLPPSPIQKKKLKVKKSKTQKLVENFDLQNIVRKEKGKILKKKPKRKNDKINFGVKSNDGEELISLNSLKETKRLKKKKQKKLKLNTSGSDVNLTEKIENNEPTENFEVESEGKQKVTSFNSDKEGKPLKKKKKKKHKLNTSESVNSFVASEESPDKEELVNVNYRNRERHTKAKKRKFNTSKSDEDGGETPNKKKKLSINESNAEMRIKNKIKEEMNIRDPSELARTIFVGNVPISVTKSNIKQLFAKYGDIETVRFRGIPVADVKTSKKVAAITKDFNSKRNSFLCYVKFKRKEDAVKAEVENGTIFEDHHLRVHHCLSNNKPDETKAIFVGNLSFDAKEDELWKLFETCGPISYIRIIRDGFTGMGKGFAYINFKESDAVQLALEMENVTYKDRELRISHCSVNSARKKKKHNKRNNQFDRSRKETGKKQNQNKKFHKTNGVPKEKNNNPTYPKFTRQNNAEFQGKKFTEKKKKHKVNKGLLEKKKMVKKIAPKEK